MSDTPAPSVTRLLADLHAYRLQTMAKEDLQVNIDQRQLLEDTADRAAFIKAGDVIEPFSLPEVLGGTVELENLGPWLRPEPSARHHLHGQRGGAGPFPRRGR